MRRLVWFVIAMVACGGNPWSVAGAPDVPPDGEFRTGVEAGEDVYVWQCYKGNRVVVRQFGSACFGTRAPELDKGPCGAPLATESYFQQETHGDNVPETKRWPGVPATGLPPFVYDAGASAPVADAGPVTIGSTILVPGPAPEAGTTVGAATSKAAAEANAALDRAYAKSSKRPGAVASPHTGAWVTEADAHVDGDAKSGWRITWQHHPPAGFEFEASVTVAPDGTTKVTKADATFAPD